MQTFLTNKLIDALCTKEIKLRIVNDRIKQMATHIVELKRNEIRKKKDYLEWS